MVNVKICYEKQDTGLVEAKRDEHEKVKEKETL